MVEDDLNLSAKQAQEPVSMRTSFTAYRYNGTPYGNDARGDIKPQMGKC